MFAASRLEYKAVGAVFDDGRPFVYLASRAHILPFKLHPRVAQILPRFLRQSEPCSAVP